jgi:caffeoyl-CoA O-methyltransferase
LKPLIVGSLEEYAADHAAEVPDLLEELRVYTYEKVDMPQMQVGRIEGNFLQTLVRIMSAERVLEIGTFTGYSALMMAAGLPDSGRLITCDINPETAAVAKSFFDRAPYGDKIEQCLGPALETIARLEDSFDLAFIDADKPNYTNYFKAIYPKMRKGGLIVADNVLWSGRVAEDPEGWDDATRGIAEFNAYVKAFQSTGKVMLTVRDGMYLIVV